ncbi:MAG: arylsulfotransferase family protein [Candidatus Eisenbacteria bacterium]
MLLILAAVLVVGTPDVSLSQRRFDNDPAAGSSTMGPSGRWRRARPSLGHTGMTAAQRAEVERLRSIGYLSGTNPAPEATGITVYDMDSAQPGLNFYNSGHHAGAALMTMDGDILHEWEFPFLKAFPDSLAASKNDGAEYWRYAKLFENGDVLAIFEGLGLIKVDKDSRLLWAHAGSEHHALHAMDDGRIYVLTRKAHIVPSVNTVQPVLEDFITILDANGNELRSVSVLAAFLDSRYENAPFVYGMGKTGDLFHTNAIRVLDGMLEDRHPAFRKGNVLVSMRQLNLIAIVDMEYEQVAWIASGMWRQQHDPKMLPNGNMLLFDNKGYGGQSKVVEFDPLTFEVAWSYYGKDSEPFYSQMCGASYRLENGNTLVTESDYGRAFEVAPDGRIVWEFVSQERAGKDGSLIATLFEVTRVDPEDLGDWVDLE